MSNKTNLNYKKMKFPNRIRYLGLSSAISSVTRGNSGSRMSMQYAQTRQSVVPREADISRILTGSEEQMADYTFGCRAPDDLQVVSIIPKYEAGITEEGISGNPLLTVIYLSMSEEHGGEYGVFHVERFQNQLERVHETFSFEYKMLVDLYEGKMLKKNEPITISPNIDDNGLYSTAVSANTVYLSMPATIEDGFIASKSFLERGQPVATSFRTAEWGRKYFPINLYGDENTYKPFPEIGDKVRPDGLVFALRKYEDNLSGLEMTAESLMVVDYLHDKLEYGKPGATVYDVVVDTTTNEYNRKPKTPIGMEQVVKKYSDQQSRYYEKIIEETDRIMKDNHYEVRFTPMLQTLVAQAKGDKPNFYDKRMRGSVPRKNDRDTIVKTYRAAPIDEWRVEVHYQYRFPMGEGAKLSNLSAGKGVVCQIMEDEDMPVDEFGNRADLVVYGKGAVARLNPGQFYEQFINACSRDITLDVKAMMDKGDMEGAWNHFIRYLQIAAPKQLELLDVNDPETRDETLKGIYKDGIYLFIPADDPNFGINIYQKMMEFRPPNKSKVTYTDVMGVRRTTVKPVLIGAMQTVVLEKIDHKPMAVSGILRQHHGLPAVQNKSTKYTRPTKEQAPRVIGETESRTLSAIIGGDAVANLIDLAGNPTTHRESISALYTAENPAKVPNAVDRDKNPPNGRAIAFVKHVLKCAGVELTDNNLNM